MKKIWYALFVVLAIGLLVWAIAAWKSPLVVTMDRDLKMENGGVLLTMAVGPFQKVRTVWFATPYEADQYVRQLRHDPRVDLRMK